MSPGMSSSSARIGVIPTPPAMRATRRPVVVKPPNGPSTTTRVPGRMSRSERVWSPSPLTVIRSRRPSGAAESENGCASHQ